VRNLFVWGAVAMCAATVGCSDKVKKPKPAIAQGGPGAPELGWHESGEAAERAPISLTASDGSGLELVALHARTVIEDPLAFTELHLTFNNPEPRRREGRFEIALPPQAAISRFAMRVGDRFQEGEVVERRHAQQVYEDFLHRRQDPALLEKDAGNEFAARVFPIEANADKEIIIAYSEELQRSDEPYRLLLNGLPKLRDIKVDVRVGSSSGSGRESSQRARGAVAQLQLYDDDFVPRGDLEVRLPWQKTVALRSGELVLARVAPVLPVQRSAIEGLTVLFDTSASRALGFGAQVERLGALIEALRAGESGDFPLRVVAFDQDAAETYRGPASGFGLRQKSALLERGALGATDLAQALAFVARDRERFARVLVVGDGVVTAGADDTTALREAVAKLAAHGVQRLDVLGEGGIRDLESLTALARSGLPAAGVVLDARMPVAALAERLVHATAAKVQVKIAGASWVYPDVLEGVQAGDERLVFAELPAGTPLQIELLGAGIAAPAMLEVPRPLLERAWARAKIEAMTGQLRALPADDGTARGVMQREIIELSLAQRVVSDYTALLVLETDEDYRRFGIAQNALANILRVGDEGIELVDRDELERNQGSDDRLKVARRDDRPVERFEQPPSVEEPPREQAEAEPPASAAPAAAAPPVRSRPAPTLAPAAKNDEGSASASLRKRAAAEPEAKAEAEMARAPASASAEPAAAPGMADELREADKAKGSTRQPSGGFAPPPPASPPAPTSASASAPAKPTRAAEASDDLDVLGTLGGLGRRGAGAGIGTGTGAADSSASAGERVAANAGPRAEGAPLQVATPPVLAPRATVRLHNAYGVPGPAAAQVLRGALAAGARGCYERASVRNGSERLALEIQLSEKGTVSDAYVTGGSLGDPRAQACVLAAARRLRFPKPETGRASVTAGVEFSFAEVAARTPIAAPAGQPRPRPRAQIATPAIADAYDGALAEVLAALGRGDRSAALALANSAHGDDPGDVIGLVALGEALEAQQDYARAARAYGSIIDLFPSRADLRRMAAGRLERVPSAGLALAVDSYRRAVEQRPDHPSGHRSLAYALLKQGDRAGAFATIEQALARSYAPDRFEGVDRILRDDLALIGAAWLRAEPAAETKVRDHLASFGVQPERAPSLRFVLSWETDANDVDFHIYDGRGGHAYYMKPKLGSGGSLYADITTGYGPECFAISGRARSYPYVLQAHYFARGPMGYGMGKLQVIDHDGQGGLRFSEHPFTIMKDKAFVELARLPAPLAQGS
jgi:tetratricopeptide (TPR) repeat protein